MPKTASLEQGGKNTCKRSGSLVLQNSMFTLIKMTLKYKNCKDYPDTGRAHKSKAQARNFFVFGGKAIATHQDRPFTVKLRYWEHQKYF